jgi:hypothetical protein
MDNKLLLNLIIKLTEESSFYQIKVNCLTIILNLCQFKD